MTALYQSAPCRCGACRTFVVIETRLHQPVATAPTAWSAARFASAMNIAAEGGVEVLEPPEPVLPIRKLRVVIGGLAVGFVGYLTVVGLMVVAAPR